MMWPFQITRNQNAQVSHSKSARNDAVTKKIIIINTAFTFNRKKLTLGRGKRQLPIDSEIFHFVKIKLQFTFVGTKRVLHH